MYPAAQDLKSTHEFLPVDARDSICLCFFLQTGGKRSMQKELLSLQPPINMQWFLVLLFQLCLMAESL